MFDGDYDFSRIDPELTSRIDANDLTPAERKYWEVRRAAHVLYMREQLNTTERAYAMIAGEAALKSSFRILPTISASRLTPSEIHDKSFSNAADAVHWILCAMKPELAEDLFTLRYRDMAQTAELPKTSKPRTIPSGRGR